MIRLILWITVLIFLLLVCIAFSKRVLLTPQFVYVGCFLPQAVFSLYFVSKWNIKLSVETMYVLIGGTTLFVVASILFDRFFSKIKSSGFRAKKLQNNTSPAILVERWKLLFLLLFQVAALVIYIVFGLSTVPGGSLLEKMSALNSNTKFGDIEDVIRFPRWVIWPIIISTFSSYITGYLLFHSIIFKYKQKRILLTLSLVLGIVEYMIVLGRMSAVGLIISLAAQVYFIWGESTKWTKRVSMRFLTIILVIGVIILALFQWLLQFVGRSDSASFLDYLGSYISAPLRNLDVFVRSKNFGNRISNWETLMQLVNYLGRTFGITEWVHQHDLPFVTANGVRFGNVYTLYHSYLHDGGYPAVILFVLLEAFIAQILFHKAIKRPRRSQINLSLIIYSHVLCAIFYGFFMERFYTVFISMKMVRTIVCWWIFSWFFTTRFRFSSKRTKVTIKMGKTKINSENVLN